MTDITNWPELAVKQAADNISSDAARSEICTSPGCGKEIEISIFKGSGYCSVDCKKIAGIDHPPYGNMMVVTPEEERLIHERRKEARQA